LYLVNQGTITFHTQMARVDDPDHPDLMVLDVDPPEGAATSAKTIRGRAASSAATPLQRAAEVAFILRERLREEGWEPVVKTSGKRGLHLAFRLDGRSDFDAARAQVKTLFQEAATAHHRLLTTKIRKAKRGGRVYLDALRMSAGATVVPPYVARPTPEATVSMPVTWEELETLSDGRVFTIDTALTRLAKTGDLWQGLVA
jgi:bifunctional non-homologous end joining protein LigD